MLKRIIVICLLLLALSGCAPAPAVQPTAPPATVPPTSVALADIPTAVPVATSTPQPLAPPATAQPIPPPQPAKPAPTPEYQWSNVWGNSATDVFVVGWEGKPMSGDESGHPGRILHYDGSQWSPMNSPATDWLGFLWGSSGSDVYATGHGGTLLHYDGNSWSAIESGTSYTLLGIWGSSASDVFVVGNGGTILHFDGSKWSPMKSGTSTWLIGVWGSSGSDVYAVGDSGTILHYDGKTWSRVKSDSYSDLWGVWGSSGSDVFVTGETGGTILHYDGNAWSPMNGSTTADMWGSPWGSSGSDVFAAGAGGAIVHYDGKTWSPMETGTSSDFEGVWGSSANDVFAVGDNNTILHYDGRAWSPMSGGMPATAAVVTTQPTPPSQTVEALMPPGSLLNAVWGNSASDVFAVGYDGNCCKLILHYDGRAWSTMSQGVLPWLDGVWSNSGEDAFAVGAYGTILHYDGNDWSLMNSGTNKTLITVWGSSGSDVFAVGENGTILHYNGQVWSPMQSGWPVKPLTYPERRGLGTSAYLFGVWGSSATDVFAVGDAGAILHYDGQAWAAMNSGTAIGLGPVWGSSGNDVFAAGENGTILHYDGQAWSPMQSGTTEEIDGLWGSSASDVFAAGGDGAILHYDGQAWSLMSSTGKPFINMWGSSGSDIFAVGDFRSVLHYDGKVWSDMSRGAPVATPVAEAPAVTPQPAKPTPQPTVELIREKITSKALAGNLLGDPAERTIYVLLPPGYATSDKRYPVVYVLPWGDGEPSANAWGFKGAMESLLDKGESKEMIVVAPDATSKLGNSYFMSSPTIGDHATYLTQEVANYIDTHYRTMPTRDSRGLTGCSSGGEASMRLALKYPNVYSVVAATGGVYDYSLEAWPEDVATVQRLTKLPHDFNDLALWELAGWIQTAAVAVPDPNNPPFYSEMPVRIVNGQGEFVPEVVAKIAELDAMHEARRYLQQPLRLRGILIHHGLYDSTTPIKHGRGFDQLLTDLGIEHEYVEEKTGHCGTGWEATLLKYMSDKLAFEEQ